MTRSGSPAQPRASRYDGPLTVSVLVVAGRSIRLVQPQDPDRLLDAADVRALNRSEDYMPYWAYLWPGALLLAEAVAQEPWPDGQRALEIGCGLGLAGLVGISAGLRVHFTDYDETPLRFVVRSAAENGFEAATFSTGKLDWRDPPDRRYPVILGADVLYERRLVPLVVGVLERMLEPDGVALLAGPYRVANEDLAPTLAAAGLRAESRSVTARNEAGGSVRGTLNRIWKGR